MDCKSTGIAFTGSNPVLPTTFKNPKRPINKGSAGFILKNRTSSKILEIAGKFVTHCHPEMDPFGWISGRVALDSRIGAVDASIDECVGCAPWGCLIRCHFRPPQIRLVPKISFRVALAEKIQVNRRVAKYWETIIEKWKSAGWEVRWIEAMHDGEAGWTATATRGRERHSSHANDLTLAFQELEANCGTIPKSPA